MKFLKNNGFLLENTMKDLEEEISELIKKSSFLVLGAAGTIGKAVTKEIFNRNPKILHAVDISENNIVELVRDIRSSAGYIQGEFKTYAISVGSNEFDAFLNNSPEYDYVLNLSALKHVRSEKDPFTLMRMTMVNIINNVKILQKLRETKIKNYFCVSTDKATDPVNMMGASKRIMELFLSSESKYQNVGMARFANVSFSDGSLLHGFDQRYLLQQPITAPLGIKRYFISQKDAGCLCLLATLFGDNNEIFFPKLDMQKDLVSFKDIATTYVEEKGFKVYQCSSEAEAREKINDLISQKYWPCYFFDSDTTGEKDHEEFWSDGDTLILNKFRSIGIIKQSEINLDKELNSFFNKIDLLRTNGSWTRAELIVLYKNLLPNFSHSDKGKFLDERM